jgi:hypothetical protein
MVVDQEHRRCCRHASPLVCAGEDTNGSLAQRRDCGTLAAKRPSNRREERRPIMDRRLVIAAAAAAFVGRPALANDGFTLVTPSLAAAEQRFEAEHGASLPNLPRTRSLFPSIRIVSPQTNGAEMASPLRIELVFETSGDAHIVPSTFRVLYGLLKFDLTDNVRQNATLSEKGLLAEKAAVPKGTHRLFLQIADDKGRVTEQELRVKIAG